MSTTGTRSAIRRPASITAGSVVPGGERARAGGLDDRAVGERVRERHAELDEVGARVRAGLADADRPLDVGEAAHQVGHQRRAPGRGGERGGDPLESGVGADHVEAELGQRLGEVLVAAARQADEVDGVRPAPARPRRAPRRSRARTRAPGRCPPARRALAKASIACCVGHGRVARAARVAQVRVLGAGAGVVEPGRDRVRLEDLAVLVLHDRREGAVQDAAAPARWSAARRGGRSRSRRPRPRRRSARRPRRRRTGQKMPIAFEPPPTQATTRSGRRPERLRAAGRAPRRRSRAAGRARAPGTAPGRRRSRSRSACPPRSSTQSRIAAEVASLSVRVPASTGSTRAPSSCMRCTLGCWRRMSSVPM